MRSLPNAKLDPWAHGRRAVAVTGLALVMASLAACSRQRVLPEVTQHANVAAAAFVHAGEQVDVVERDADEERLREPDVVYVPTPQPVVDRMLELAKVSEDDLVYDLGCGDGRILVTAAKRHGARGYGVDIDPERVSEARANVEKNGVQKLVKIERGDAFETDLRKATVVTLYLLPSLNVKLLPQLQGLRAGVPVVSHDFAIEGVEPDKVEMLEAEGRQHRIYLFTTPLERTTGPST